MSWSLNTPSMLKPRVTKAFLTLMISFFYLASVLVIFNVDLLYIIVMLMLPDGLESSTAHSHHVSIITVINFMQVLLQAH